MRSAISGAGSFRLRLRLTALWGATLALWFTACAQIKPLPPAASREAACGQFFDEMDRGVAREGVADAGPARIPGYPELRVDRFLASFPNADLGGVAFGTWVDRLRKLDETARRIEWRNLPPAAAARLHPPFGLDAGTAIALCGPVLAGRDLKSPAGRSRLLQQAQAPDSYSTWQRAFGLYPLTRWAILEGVWRVQRELRQPFLGKQEAPTSGRWTPYAPPVAETLDTAETARILEQSAANPLGIPEPDDRDLARLFAAHAPIWSVDTRSDDDRIGAVRIGAEGKAGIDVHRPVVYRLVSHARFAGRVVLQLVYVVWFPARPPEGILDLYAGRFDGLIWRVTLGPDSRPLAYDSIHPCGCYYQVFPGPGYRVAQPSDGSEPILSPTPIPRLAPGQRLAIRLATRTHFIQGIGPEPVPAGARTYGWADYDQLRSLPVPGDGHRSLFAPDGLLRASARPERLILWPMGVPSAGAMRQWGTHAIAFLGKRHFDDPWLLQEFLRPLSE